MYRERAGFKTPGAAARQLRLEGSYYRKIETGLAKPGADTLIALARGFGCTTDELLGLRPEASA
jgi:transcriptional regulator with XRE-family HTH domain